MRKAILTGHSRGLGAAIAEELLREGVHVLAISRRGNEALAARYADLLTEAALDLADPAFVAWAKGPTIADFLDDATLALLVNNAGVVQPIGPMGSLDADEILCAVTLNVAAPLALTNCFLAASGSAADRRVLYVSSGAARSAIPGWSIYCATKAALDHHARTLVSEELPGLRVESLAPGVIDTDMQAQIRATTPEQFALRDRFIALKEENALLGPADCASRTVAHLLDERFGLDTLTDLRSLG